MAAELILAPEAVQDLAEGYAWYEDRRTGLGEEFLSCVEACMEAIRRMPEMYAVVHEDYGRGLVRRFPYAVFYESTEETARPLAATKRTANSEQSKNGAMTWLRGFRVFRVFRC